MLLNDFSGGLNIRVAPSLLQPTESQVYTNIDNAAGSIRPIKGSVLHTASVNKYFAWYYAASEFIFSATAKTTVEYKDVLYSTNPGSYPTKYDGTDTYRLGIVKPSTPLTVTRLYEKGYTELTTGDLPLGTHQYILVNTVAGASGDIVTKTDITAVLTGSNDAVRILWEADTGSTNIYRLYNGTYRKVNATPVSADYDDVVYDISAGAELGAIYSETYSYVYTYYNSTNGNESAPCDPSEEIIAYEPLGSEYGNSRLDLATFTATADAQVDKFRVYRIGGALSNYTLVATLDDTATVYVDNTSDIDLAGNHVLDTLGYQEAPTDLRYMTEAYAMLFGALDDKLYYSNIAVPDAWPATNFIDFDDTITGMAPVQGGLLVFTMFKTYIVVGTTPSSFSKYLVDSEQGCLGHNTIEFVNGSVVWLSQDGLCTTTGGSAQIISLPQLGKLSLTGVQNAQVLDSVYYLAHDAGILVMDFRYNVTVRNIGLVVDWLGAYADSLYFTQGGDLYTMFAGENMAYVYKSPMLTDGSYSHLKIYKDFYIKYNGNVKVTLYVDGEVINTKELSGNKSYNLKALSGSEGYGLEIELEGTAEISEIEYKVTGRQNGR